MQNHPSFERLLRKIERRTNVEKADLEALRSLSFQAKNYDRGDYVVRQGNKYSQSALILEGFAYRHKVTEEGRRQIVSFHIPGDFVDLEASLLKVADHNVEALTPCELGHVPTHEIIALIDNHPRLGRALWIVTLIDASIYREWVMNVGRRPAKQRIAHLLCEFAVRLKLAGEGSEAGFTLPMTQDELADATGLTQMHINRSLKTLGTDGLIQREGRFVHIPDWKMLRASCGFSELYLHLDQAA